MADGKSEGMLEVVESENERKIFSLSVSVILCENRTQYKSSNWLLSAYYQRDFNSSR